MKIMQIIPGNVWGGAEQYILDLGSKLMDEGHEVKFLCNDSEPVTDRLKGIVEYDVIGRGGLYNLSRIPQLAEYIATFKPDVVHVHNRKMVYAVSRAAGRAGSEAKIVLTYHDCHRNSPPFWQRGSFRRLHRMIFVSDFAFRRWHGSNRWMPEGLCSVVINSIKGEKTAPKAAESLRSLYGISPATPLLLFSGRVRKSKGCELIVRSLARLKDMDWRMVFVGGYSPAGYGDRLKKLAEELGIGDRVYLHGFSRDARSLISEADLCLAPSIMLDPCPLAPLESMKEGKCVIASDSGGQPEYIADGRSGLIVGRGDEEALAEAIRGMIADPSRRQSIGEEAKRHFDADLNYETFASRIMAIYRS